LNKFAIISLMNIEETQNTETTEIKVFTVEEELKFQNEVLSFIDERIRPSLMMDGGDMTILDFHKLPSGKYQIFLELTGACGHCPSANFTLKMGVERLLVENFPIIEGVVAN